MKQFWLLVAVFFFALLQGGGLLHAGAKTKCEKPACGMKMCAAMAKGKPNGQNCSNRCSKTCCFCKANCPRDEYRGAYPNDDQQ